MPAIHGDIYHSLAPGRPDAAAAAALVGCGLGQTSTVPAASKQFNSSANSTNARRTTNK